jgi:hypothetical protein
VSVTVEDNGNIDIHNVNANDKIWRVAKNKKNLVTDSGKEFRTGEIVIGKFTINIYS